MRALLGVLAIVTLAAQEAPLFRTQTRLVEVYVTVTDGKGRVRAGLQRDDFRLREAGREQPIVAFEAESSDLTCAILLDTTGSMEAALPQVKHAVVTFLDQLRPNDTVVVYTFSSSLRLAQPATRDKNLAKRAVLRTRAEGGTALFDGIAQAVTQLLPHKGRKALVVFSDGDDNASTLAAPAASKRARSTGIPVFAVAQGEALKQKPLLSVLEEMARATGGELYTARKAEQVREMFLDISGQLRSMYLLAFAARSDETAAARWRPIEVTVTAGDRLKVRAREGYYAD